MAKKHKAVLLTHSVTYALICLLSLGMICGSFLLKFNYGEEVTADQKVIQYSYQNESDDPTKRNHFRRIKIKISNSLNFFKMNTKNMRVTVHREGEMGDKNLMTGIVFSLILEDMAKFKSVIFDYNRCVTENETTTDIFIYLFKKYESDLALKVMTVSINRLNDKIAIIGKEISASDIWSDSLINKDIINKRIVLEKGYLRLLMEEKEQDEHS